MPFAQTIHAYALHLLLPILLLLSSNCRVTNAADQKHWELSPYRVQIHLAVDDTQLPQAELGHIIATRLKQRIRATIYPLWSTKISVTSGVEKQRQLAELRHFGKDLLEGTEVDMPKIDALTAGYDKQLFLNVRTTHLGVTLESREFDCMTLRWSAVQKRSIRQNWMLPTQCFDLVCQTFSPLATIRPMAAEKKNEAEILLHFRGSDLPRQSELSFLRTPGEVYQPLMVRTNSQGEVKLGSIRNIPWTYLTLSEQMEDGWHGAVHTGTRRPFGARRRGRVEHLALAMRNPSGPTRVRFYARHDQSQGLSGYEVFRRGPAADKSLPLGLTDTHGAVQIQPDGDSVSLLFLRSDGQLLAKVPVVPGASANIEVPVADDTARLRAQAALTSLTEQLIDTVAQRNILISRVRARIADGEIPAAQQLFSDLDDLPGRAKFNQQITTAENRKLNKSDDPKVQARIEKLFADTRKLLGRFLNTKQISDLQAELNAARSGNGN